MRTLIIAEVGVNHNGDLNLAKELIIAAKKAGADLVKFQTFQTSKSITKDAEKATYQKIATGNFESQYEMVSKLEISAMGHKYLVSECDRQGIKFFSTAFDTQSFDLLVSLGLDKVKVPSGELTNLPLLRYFAKFGLPIILSTGMANLGETEAAIEAIIEAGTPRNLITALHCTTEYPAPMAEVNLKAMVNMHAALGVAVGYSDHTNGIEIPIAAVALGAVIIEKHLTLDRSLPGPDHLASIEPHEFQKMVESIRNVEKAMGDGLKRPTPSEIKNKMIARKSLVAIQHIRAGEKFSPQNIGAKRPGNGISPMRWDEIMKRHATRDFFVDELIKI